MRATLLAACCAFAAACGVRAGFEPDPCHDISSLECASDTDCSNIDACAVALVQSDGQALAPGVSFSRPAPAYYVDASRSLRLAAADRPRWTHDWEDGTPLGLWIEPASTNHVPFSEDLSRWTSVNTVLTSGQQAPDGEATAWLVQPPATAADHHLEIVTAPVKVDGQLAVSFYLRSSGSDSFVTLEILTGSSLQCSIGYSPGLGSTRAAFAGGNGGTWARLMRGPDGWVRVRAGFKTGLTHDGPLTVRLSLRDEQQDPVADPADPGSVVWGVQLETGDFTSYIPTHGAAATRPAERLVHAALGTRSVLATARLLPEGLARTRTILEARGAAGGLTLQLERDATAPRTNLVAAGAASGKEAVVGPVTEEDEHGLLAVIDAAACRVYTDGGATARLPEPAFAPQLLSVGATATGQRLLNGLLRQVLSWPGALPDAVAGQRARQEP